MSLGVASISSKNLIPVFETYKRGLMTDSYQVERQMGKLSPFLNFKMKDGSSLAVPYSLIMQIHLFSEAEMMIRLGQMDVTIEGSGLSTIHDYLLQQRLMEVSENGHSLIKQDEKVEIRSISMLSVD